MAFGVAGRYVRILSALKVEKVSKGHCVDIKVTRKNCVFFWYGRSIDGEHTAIAQKGRTNKKQMKMMATFYGHQIEVIFSQWTL